MSLAAARISALREKMRERGMDAYIVFTEDFHGSEYVGGHFRLREYLSGFTGSAGTLVVTQKQAALWTDGRYFLQAEEQLRGSGIDLMKSGERDVPTIEGYLLDKIPIGGRLGFDGRTACAQFADELQSALRERNVDIAAQEDVGGLVWENRPPLSKQPVWELPEKYAGASRKEKLAKIRECMDKAGADVLILSALDEIAWTLNLRGDDVEYNPVFLSYMTVRRDSVQLFADSGIFGGEIIGRLAEDGVTVLAYEEVYSALGELRPDEGVMLDPRAVSCLLERSIPEAVKRIKAQSPVLKLKAVKNAREIECERSAHLKDGIALTRFMYWLKHSIGKEEITEISAAERLEAFRKQGEGYLGQSFAPIMAYGAHGAVVHYSADEQSNASLLPRGLLLSDTGGHYLEGTTDVTRTYALGELTQEERRCFTLVLAGHLRLAAAVFRYGCRGANLDYAAREPLWRNGLDFNHGTGHGVGFLLNVHESPNRICWRIRKDLSDDCVLEDGMITSNEPGFYASGKFGIRHESLILCRERQTTEYGRFMEFETLTLAPFDPSGVDVDLLTDEELALFNAYQKRVCESISAYLPENEAEWLRELTKPLYRSESK